MAAAAPPRSASPELAARAEAFIAAYGRRPEREDIRNDAAWWELYESKKAGERAQARQRPGGCGVYIVRRRRFCSHAAADGLGGLCSEHAAAAASTAAAPLLPSRVDETAAAGRKRNLKRRMKRMTNPTSYREEVAAPEWSAVFADASLPTLLDIGCAKGRFLAALSTDEAFKAVHGAHNFVGVEIYAPLVAAANAWRDAAGVRNLHYVAANVNASLPLLAIPRLTKVCIQVSAHKPRSSSVVACRLMLPALTPYAQFPDPWQDDNAARRVVTPALADALAAALSAGGEVLIVSDVCSLAESMRAIMLAQGSFALHPLHAHAGADHGWGEDACRGDGSAGGSSEPSRPAPAGGWLRVRPYGVPTERDKVCEAKWRPVYRTLLVRV